MSEVQGVINKLRKSGYLFSLACLSVTGAPPFGVFVGEFLILVQAIDTGNLVIAGLLAIVYMYAFIGLNRQTIQMVFGEPIEEQGRLNSIHKKEANVLVTGTGSEKIAKSGEETKISVIIPTINLAISLVIGIYMVPTLVQAALSLNL